MNPSSTSQAQAAPSRPPAAATSVRSEAVGAGGDAESGSSPGSRDGSSGDRSAPAGDSDIPPEPGAVSVELTIDPAVERAVDSAWLVRHVQRAVEYLPKASVDAAVAHVVVIVVDDERMRAMHRTYCDLDSTTDVLTFPVSEPGEPIEVEIAVCAEEAVRRIAVMGHCVEHELLLYILHGLLHCCGFDDHDEAAFARMHAAEDAILESIGVGATFNARRNVAPTEHQGDETA